MVAQPGSMGYLDGVGFPWKDVKVGKDVAILTRNELEKALAEIERDAFYVYILYRPDRTPFYVGKGKGRRVLHHEREALGIGKTHKLNTIRAISRSGGQIGYSIVEVFDDEARCHSLEIELIRRYGRHDLGTGPLTNLTDGGEGAAGLSEETRMRIDAELHGPDAPGERGIANRFFLKLCEQVRSVPVRPLSSVRLRPTLPHRSARRPTPRMAAVLAASAIANRVLIETGASLPRVLEVDGTAMAIENGVASDILKAGLATLQPARDPVGEEFLLNETGVSALLDLIGEPVLVAAGVLIPELRSGPGTGLS